MWISRTAYNLLCEMRAAEDNGDDLHAELVADRGKHSECYHGYRRIKYVTIQRMLAMMVISDRTDEGGQLERYRINELGRAVLRNPGLLQDIVRVQQRGGAWRIENDQLVQLK